MQLIGLMFDVKIIFLILSLSLYIYIYKAFIKENVIFY